MADTPDADDGVTTPEGVSDDAVVETDGGTPRRDHGGFVDIERFPGGSTVTALWTDVAARYEGYLTFDKDEKETIHRWRLGLRISHWAMVVFMFVAIVTGVAFWTGWYGPMNIGIWDGYQVAFQLHIWSGVLLAVVALLLYPYYHAVVEGHHLLLSREQLKEVIIIGLAFVGLVRYIPGYKKARRTYDTDRGGWAGHHPMQTVFWYVTWLFVIVLTLTGFALWDALATDPAWWIAALGFMEGWVTYETMLRLHLIATFWVIGAIALHAYYPLMPSNHDVLRSMFTGKIEGWTVDDETRPQSADVTPAEPTDEESGESTDE